MLATESGGVELRFGKLWPKCSTEYRLCTVQMRRLSSLRHLVVNYMPEYGIVRRVNSTDWRKNRIYVICVEFHANPTVAITE